MMRWGELGAQATLNSGAERRGDRGTELAVQEGLETWQDETKERPAGGG